MASIEVRDETVIVATRDLLAAIVADRARWVQWWPGLEVRVAADRGPAGMSWAVAGPLVGAVEIVLAEVTETDSPADRTSVSVHYVLEVDPTMPGSRTTPRRLPDSPHGRRELADLHRQQAMAWKRTVWALKDEVEVTIHAGRSTVRYGA